MTNARTPHQIMQLYLKDVVEAGDLALLDEIAAEDMVDHTAVAAGWGGGREGLIRHVTEFRRILPDLEVDIERIIASDNEVVGLWRVRGTHRRNLFGVQATGKPLDYRNASFFRVRDGWITDYTGVWGALDAVRQMGVSIKLP